MLATITAALFLSVIVNRVVEHLFKPLRSLLLLYLSTNKLVWLDFISPYVAWILGGVLAWYTNINLLAQFSLPPIVARIATAIIIGGGAGLIHDIFDPLPTKGREFWAKMYGIFPDAELDLEERKKDLACDCD